MPSYQEELRALAESAKRRASPESMEPKSYAEELRDLANKAYGAAKQAGTEIDTIMKRAAEQGAGREAGVDYSMGVQRKDSGRQDFNFRWKLSALRSPDEKKKFLDEKLGEGMWGEDPAGHIIVTTAAADKMGWKHRGAPIAVDPHRLEAGDIAELEWGPILGGIAAGTLTGGMGFFPGMMATGLGGAAGTLVPEALQSTGRTTPFEATDPAVTQQETPEQIAKRARTNFALESGGEGIARALMPAGRLALNPYTRRKFQPFAVNRDLPYNKIPQARRALTKEVMDEGMMPYVGTTTQGSLMQRFEGLVHNIFGDPYAEKNLRGIGDMVSRTQGRAGGNAPEGYILGETIENTLRKRQSALYGEAKRRYAEFGNMARAEGFPEDIVSLKNLKAKASEIAGRAPKRIDDAGQRVPSRLGPEQQALRDNILDLADTQTPEEALELWNRISDAAYDPDAFPGISKRTARELKFALDADFSDLDRVLKSTNAKPGRHLRETRKWYRETIQPLKDSRLRPVLRPEDQAGNQTVFDFVNQAVKGKSVARLEALKNALGPNSPEWRDTQAYFMSTLLDNVWKQGDDPLDVVASGQALKRALGRYNREQLASVFGKELADDLHRSAEKMSFVTQKMKNRSGGLVAANIALAPFRNLSKMAKIFLIGHLFSRPKFVKWLIRDPQDIGPRAAAEMSAFVARTMSQIATQNDIRKEDLPPLSLPSPVEE